MITESRLKTGRLVFGTDAVDPTVFACQATSVKVTPSYEDDGDPLETLCGDSIAAGKKESWVISGTSVQDFDDPDGFLSYCFAHRMQTVTFSWQANAAAPTWSGSCVLLALEEGGEVNVRLTTDWEFEVVGIPTRAYVPPPAWSATTAYTVGNRVTLSGGQVLEATVAGTSDAVEPVAPAAVGGTVTDGTVTWKRIS